MDKVLLADNDPRHLSAWAEVLRSEGYEVTTASSASETQELLIRGGFDAAVLDLHMEADEDEYDDSGLRLARNFRESVPIIILTGKPTIQTTRDALSRDGGFAPAVAVVRKLEDGPGILLKAVREAIVPKIFISEGNNVEVATSMARFIKDAGGRAIEYREQAMERQTTLDIFESHSNIQFAVIIMTADEEGRSRGESSLRERIRQSVIFDLGFFLAKLGRHRVVTVSLQGESIELPSSLQGVLNIEIDPYGDWLQKLKKNMRSVGVRLR